MKKRLLCLCLFVMMLCGCEKKVEIHNVDLTYGITPLTYEMLQEKIDNDHYFILYIGRSDCQDCKEFYPQLENFLQEHQDLGVYYLDVKAFRDAARKEGATQEEIDFFENLTETLAFDWVPTLQQRQGQDILSSVTYLDMDYYEIEDKDKQASAKEKYLNDIYTWLDDVGRK